MCVHLLLHTDQGMHSQYSCVIHPLLTLYSSPAKFKDQTYSCPVRVFFGHWASSFAKACFGVFWAAHHNPITTAIPVPFMAARPRCLDARNMGEKREDR